MTAGANVTVTGAGSAGNPYIISAVAAPISTLDTATVDLSVSVNPLTANVKLDPVAGNLIFATANGLRIDCAAIAACLVATGLTVTDTTSVNLTLTGTGAPGDPYILNAAALVSGGLLSIGPGGITLTCANIRTCLNAGPGIAYNPATGTISAFLSTDAGNNIAFGTDNGLFVPTGSATVSVACGLTGDGSGGDPLTVNTANAVWPPAFACPPGSGSPIYCDPDGALRGTPEKFVLTRRANLNVVIPTTQLNTLAVVGGGNTVVGPNVVLAFTNPDPCRDMELWIEAGINHLQAQYVGVGDTNAQFDSRFQLSGAIVSALVGTGHQRWQAAGQAAGDRATFDNTTTGGMAGPFILPAGGTVNITLSAALTLTSFGGNATVAGWTNYVTATGYSI